MFGQMHARFYAGNLQIEEPFRLSDLIHTQNAVLARAEELCALDKLELGQVEPFAWGFALKPRLSQRFVDWAKNLCFARHLWMDSTELDRFATTLFLSH